MTDPTRTDRWFVERPSPNKAGHTQVCGPLSKEDAQKQMDAWRAERMDLTPYMWDIPEKETEPPAADPTRTLADLARRMRDGYGAVAKEWADELDAALAALVPPQEQETVRSAVTYKGGEPRHRKRIGEDAGSDRAEDQRDAKHELALVEQRCIGHGEGQEQTIADVNAGRIDDLIQPRLSAALIALRAQIDPLVLEMSLWCIDNKGHYHEDDIEEIVKKWADTLASLSRPQQPEEQP